MTARWRSELERVDGMDPSPGLLERARSGSTLPVAAQQRINRSPRRTPMLVAVLALVLFACLAILTPQRLANAGPDEVASVGPIHQSPPAIALLR